MYFLVLHSLFFGALLFNSRVRASPPPGRNDRTTLPTTNRNPNIFTVIPSLRFSLTLTEFLLLVTAASFYPKPFSPTLQQWRGLLRWRKASTCVRPLDRHDALWNHPDRQVTAKPLTDKSTLAGVELVSPGVHHLLPSCVRTAKALARLRMRRLAWALAGRLCDKYHNLMSWLIFCGFLDAFDV